MTKIMTIFKLIIVKKINLQIEIIQTQGTIELTAFKI